MGSRPFFKNALVLLLAGTGFLQVHANPTEVTVDERLSPGQDLVWETQREVKLSFKVLEDRGLGKELTQLPLDGLLFKSVETIRYAAGPLKADGSFLLDVHLVKMNMSVRASDGRQPDLPNFVPTEGVRVLARVDANSKVIPQSMAGVELLPQDLVQQAIVSLLTPMVSTAPQRLRVGHSTKQEVVFSVPLPDNAVANMTRQIQYQLLNVEGAIARIERLQGARMQNAQLPFDIQEKSRSEMAFDLNRQQVVSIHSEGEYIIRADLDEGVLMVNLNFQNQETVRPYQAISQ